MKLRTLFILIVLAAVGAFIALNWEIIIKPAPLSLGFIDVEAPLGLVMLVLFALLTALLLIFIVFLQTSALIDAHRHSRELKASQSLAEIAETSRFIELKGFLDSELKKLANAEKDSTAALMERLDQLESELHSALEQTGNSMIAHIGELEDRLERGDNNLASPPV